MKQLFLVALLLGGIGTSFAQKSKISGFLLDSTSKQAVEFATVALLKDSKILEGTTTEVTGKFTFNKVSGGSYQLKITFVGYRDKIINNVVVTEGNDLDLGVISVSYTHLSGATKIFLRGRMRKKPSIPLWIRCTAKDCIS